MVPALEVPGTTVCALSHLHGARKLAHVARKLTVCRTRDTRTRNASMKSSS
jgi:hypothetical protein